MRVFSKRVDNLPGSTSTSAIDEQGTRLVETIKKVQDKLQTSNIQKPPKKKSFTFPTGSEEAYESFMDKTMVTFMVSLFSPLELKAQMAQDLKLNLERQRDMYKAYNDTARAAHQRRQESEAAMEHAKKETEERMKEMQATGSAETQKAVMVLNLEVAKYMVQIQKLIDENQATLQKMASDHKAALEKPTMEAVSTLEKKLKEQRELFDKEKNTLQDSVNMQKTWADELQTTLNNYMSKGGCFPGTSRVHTRHRRLVHMMDLRVGEEVMVRPRVWEPVVMIYDHDQDVAALFTTIVLEEGRLVDLTPNHMLLVASPSLEESRSSSITPPVALTQFSALRACQVRPGMWVCLCGPNGASADAVKVTATLEPHCMMGVFSPVPASSDTIIVDGVVCSVYAKPSDFAHVDISDPVVHAIVHACTAPLRVGALMALRFGMESWLEPKSRPPGHGATGGDGWMLKGLKLVCSSAVQFICSVANYRRPTLKLGLQ
ncbi:hypothetical protein HDU80_001101 [Chytriomyces hyalinus]|nr:hypothetical protein HDU80_001101 [Chytriomyces hyalinus]